MEKLVENYPRVRDWDQGYDILCKFLDRFGVDKVQKSNMCIVCDEIYSNISRYAYEGKKGKIGISLEFNPRVPEIIIIFSDEGVQFDPTKTKKPDVTKPIEKRRIGGLGIFIVHQIMDSVKYARRSNKNILTLTKKVKLEK